MRGPHDDAGVIMKMNLKMIMKKREKIRVTGPHGDAGGASSGLEAMCLTPSWPPLTIP